jgi:hypothetical protein
MTNKHNLYLLRSFCKDGKTIIKFGFSNTIEKRILQYKAHNPNIEIIGTYYHQDGILFERKVHSLIKSELGREWYSEDKLSILLNYIENGFKLHVYEIDAFGYINADYEDYLNEQVIRKKYKNQSYDIAVCRLRLFVLQKNKRKGMIHKTRPCIKIIHALKKMAWIFRKF